MRAQPPPKKQEVTVHHKQTLQDIQRSPHEIGRILPVPRADRRGTVMRSATQPQSSCGSAWANRHSQLCRNVNDGVAGLDMPLRPTYLMYEWNRNQPGCFFVSTRCFNYPHSVTEIRRNAIYNGALGKCQCVFMDLVFISKLRRSVSRLRPSYAPHQWLKRGWSITSGFGLNQSM
jgi:hypothetical protein